MPAETRGVKRRTECWVRSKVKYVASLPTFRGSICSLLYPTRTWPDQSNQDQNDFLPQDMLKMVLLHFPFPHHMQEREIRLLLVSCTITTAAAPSISGAPWARATKNVQKPPESNAWVMWKSLSQDFCISKNKIFWFSHTFDSSVCYCTK
jgi:hypothetical protein